MEILPSTILPWRVAGYMGFCAACHFGMFPVACAIFPSLSQLSAKQASEAKNRLMAAAHSLVMIVCTVYYWLHLNASLRIPLAEESFVSVQFDWMLGYLAFDTAYVSMFLRPTDKPTLAHHILGGASLLVAHWLGDGPSSFYLMLIFWAEISTPFLHVGMIVKAVTKRTPKSILAVFAATGLEKEVALRVAGLRRPLLPCAQLVLVLQDSTGRGRKAKAGQEAEVIVLDLDAQERRMRSNGHERVVRGPRAGQLETSKRYTEFCKQSRKRQSMFLS
eukprot:scaffold8486_cov267-Pinguiococcus_pyrenoidosus.AAC.2